MRDIAIIGGGLVGLCAALVLQHPARRVSIIEAGKLDQAKGDGLNARSIALSISSVQIFRALGIWPQIEVLAAPIRQIHVSSRGHWGVTRLDAGDYQLNALGYVIESQALSHCLLQAVEDTGEIELRQNAKFESIQQDTSVTVGFRSDQRSQQIEAEMVLIADGAQSKARAALGIGHTVVDYGQSVVISNVEVSKPKTDTAYERFTTQGPLAMLPLGGKRYACVWTLAPEQASLACTQDDSEFNSALQKCFGFRLGRIERVGKRFSIPIQRTRADSLQCGRCLLIGNAANALHPVAGQSFNLSLRDIACLYELLSEHQSKDLSGDGFASLATDYESQRLAEQRQVIGYGDGLVSLFSNELPVVDHVRAASLGLLDLVPMLKTQAAFTGMGMTFGGNRLLRGRL
jgi:2-octaprenyl-6-methoxyphenol hydroxylase